MRLTTSQPSPLAAPPRRALPPGTRLLWLGVLASLCGALLVRVRNEHTQAALAEHQIGMDDASGVLEAKLGGQKGAQRQATTLRYARDESPALRYASIDILAAQPSPQTLDAIERGFTDPASEVRKRAMEKLIDVPGGSERGFRLLLAGLRDEDTWIREDATTQINQRIGKPGSSVDKRAVPTLIAATADPQITVSSQAMHALYKLTGRAWTVSSLAAPAKRQEAAAKWQAWWQTAQKDWPAAPEFFHITALAPARADAAPDFALADVDGRRFDNDDLKGKITLINFWGTWCGPCQAEVPDLARLYAAYADGKDNGGAGNAGGMAGGSVRDNTPDSKVAIIGLACSEKSADSVRVWCREHHVPYRQILAPNDVRMAFGNIEEVPITFLLDAQGRIRHRWDGDRDYDTFHAAIERLRHETQNAPQTH